MPAHDAGQFSDDELLALLRDDSVSCETIAAEMTDAGATPHDTAHLTKAREVLRALNGDQAQAVETLPEPLREVVFSVAQREAHGERSADAIAFISALANSRDKALAKAGKKLLHGLKTRGMKVAAPISTAPVAPAPTAAETAAANATTLMSSVDGAGRRIVLLTGAVRGGFDVAQLFLSDETGVLSADMLPLGRKEYRKFLDRLFNLEDMIVVETPRPYVRGLIARALDLNARAGRPVPAGFNDAAFLLGPAVEPQSSLGRALDRPTDEAALAARGAELLAVREFRTWLPPEAHGNTLDAKLTQIESSTLYVDELQKTGAMRDAVHAAADEFWKSSAREQFAERLFDMAYVFNKVGRAEHAAMALAVAGAFIAQPDSPANSFAVALFERYLTPPPAKSAPPVPAAAQSNLIVPA